MAWFVGRAEEEGYLSAMSKMKWFKNLFSTADDPHETEYGQPYRMPNIFEVSERASPVPHNSVVMNGLVQSLPLRSLRIRTPDAVWDDRMGPDDSASLLSAFFGRVWCSGFGPLVCSNSRFFVYRSGGQTTSRRRALEFERD